MDLSEIKNQENCQNTKALMESQNFKLEIFFYTQYCALKASEK